MIDMKKQHNTSRNQDDNQIANRFETDDERLLLNFITDKNTTVETLMKLVRSPIEISDDSKIVSEDQCCN